MSDAKFLLRSCLGKSRYSSESRALAYARKAEQARKVKLRSYYCKVCLGFHLTKQKVEATA